MHQPKQRTILLLNRGLQSVNPRELGEEWCSPDFRMGPSYRPYYLLHYVLGGRGVFQIGRQTVPAAKGQLVILRPFEVMNYAADPADPWHYVWLGFETTLDIPVLHSRTLVDLPQAEHIFNAMKNADSIRIDCEYFVCGKIYELLTLLQQIAAPVKNRTVDCVYKVRDYLDTNFDRPISIEELSESVNLNAGYLSTVFRKYVGRSPQQYLIDVRLEHAASLLAGGSDVGGAAVASGYPDVYHFSKMFHKKFGLSPSDYARRNRG